MSAAILIVLATLTAVVAGRQEGDAPPQTRAAWARRIAYWLFTIVVAFEMAAAALWGLLNIEYVRVVLTGLGYPLYFHYLIAAPRIPCALALLAPRFPRLKEWAYAGAFFLYAGAAASHLLSGDRAGQSVLGPFFSSFTFAAFTLASWALRPPSRRLGQSPPAIAPSAVAWSVPVLITVGMLTVASVTLPQGAPPR